MGALRDLNILPYIHKHQTRIFFETGLGLGTGIMRAMQPEFGFNHLISIEIDKDLVDHLSITFRPDTRIQLFQGHSVFGLKALLPQIPIQFPIFFFLDAHFANADYNLGHKPLATHADGEVEIRLPLWEELNAVKELRTNKGAKDVIFCDDIFLYSEEDMFEDNVKRLGPGAVPDEQRKYLPKFIELFKDTHDSKIIKEAQGTLILSPKI